MKKQFIHENFLLGNKSAETLYHDYVKDLPIIDYHCHLPPEDIASNRSFDTITQPWIYGDHYKWRAMRTLGIDEKFITGRGTDEEKFQHWAKAVPYTLRNPLHHWTHLELARYFDIYDLLSPETAGKIYSTANEQLAGVGCRSFITQMKVEVVCTTDDPTGSLESHQSLAQSDFDTKILPSFRPDKAILIGKDSFNEYIKDLGAAASQEITSFQILCDVLKKRISYFHENGCRLSDHGLEYLFFQEFNESEIDPIFTKRRSGKELSPEETRKFQSAVLLFLSECYHEVGWVQQFHLGALRNNNRRMEKELGPDTGWDSIGDYPQAESLSSFLDALDSRGKLPKTILYNLNPADNAMMAAMVGNFNDGSVKGKVQYGSAWWFLDQKDGIIDQVNALSNMGVVSTFVGMLTDSRSFLSYPRHEYFRRILCDVFGSEIESGELPDDIPWIGKILKDISYFNAKEYFNF